MGGEHLRAERLKILKNSIEQVQIEGKEIDIEKLISVCCMDWGITKKRAIEYLEILGVKYERTP